MVHGDDPLNPMIQELTNAFLTFLVAILLVIVLRYLWIEGMTNWRRARVKLGLAIAMVLIGLGLRFGWAALARFLDGKHGTKWMDAPFIDGASLNVIMPLTSTAIITWGLLCKIHTLTPQDWGRHAWILCVTLSAVLTIVVALAR